MKYSCYSGKFLEVEAEGVESCKQVTASDPQYFDSSLAVVFTYADTCNQSPIPGISSFSSSSPLLFFPPLPLAISSLSVISFMVPPNLSREFLRHRHFFYPQVSYLFSFSWWYSSPGRIGYELLHRCHCRHCRWFPPRRRCRWYSSSSVLATAQPSSSFIFHPPFNLLSLCV